MQRDRKVWPLFRNKSVNRNCGWDKILEYVCVLSLQYIHLLKEIDFKQIKGNMMTMSQQTENLNRKAETVKTKKIKLKVQSWKELKMKLNSH